MLFRRGDTGTAVRASSAVPAVFVPVKINGREYVDGGLVSPVPVHFARQMGADVVLAVDISSPPEANPADGTLQILLQTFSIMGKSINQYELKDADVVVWPSQIGLKSADFSARKQAIDAGRAAMLAALPALKARLAAAVPTAWPRSLDGRCRQGQGRLTACSCFYSCWRPIHGRCKVF